MSILIRRIFLIQLTRLKFDRMKYENFRYLYPPRPKHKIKPSTIMQYDNGQYFAQVKTDGSNSTLYIAPDKTWQLWNRHNEKQTLYRDLEFEKLYRGNSGFIVLNGEMLNKNKKHENGKEFNHKFIIFDILVYENQILDGWTLQERIELLGKLYPAEAFRITETGVEHDEFLYQTDVKDIYRVANFVGGFEKIFHDATKLEIYEGIVIKRKNAPLQPMFKKDNNSDTMLKCRREAKNYKF